MQAKPYTCKLQVHDKKFNASDVLLYKEIPGLSVGDIIEVYHVDGDYSRLLVQLKQNFNDNANQQKGIVSIQQTLASSFYLRQYNNVTINKVDKKEVTLDMVELIIKDIFLTRGDVWRLNRAMIDSCVYINSKVDFCNTRVTINELWMKGEKVACGVVGENTKVVFRSASSIFHILIQMSAEMWEFDYTGDLFFEKAVMSFLQELFNRWKDKDMNCNHDVLIVMFSRTYYAIKSVDELSPELQNLVLRGHDGRFYQDFYKVLLQSEKQGNLQNIILDLKRSFNGYPLYVNCRQPFSEEKNQGSSAKGLGENSRAAEGNLLEAINLSLNVFEKNHINCSLEEMNCTTLIITPSSGVFEVDEELTLLTKNRLIENGVGVDLVCLAEQPLHAVPLVKYVSKSKNSSGDIYNVPQWINPSYYSKPQSKSSVFVPRMHVPEKPHPRELKLQRNPPMFNDAVDYDEYDAKVFDYCKPKSRHTTATNMSRTSVSNTLSHLTLIENSVHSSPEFSKSFTGGITKKLSVQEDLPMLLRSVSEDQSRTVPVGSCDDLKFTMDSDQEDTPKLSMEHLPSTHTESVSSSSGIRTTFNPFKPQQMARAVTLFKHRWLHTFPEHFKNVKPQVKRSSSEDFSSPSIKSPLSVMEDTLSRVSEPNSSIVDRSTDSDALDGGSDLESSINTLENTIVEKPCAATPDHYGGRSDDESFISNSTLKSEALSRTSLHPEQLTAPTFPGVDWKSLCLPSCLPLTINYFPEATSLKNQYYENNYVMVMEPDEIGPDGEKIRKEVISVSRFDRTALSPEKKFMEMISQRISKGFQFVTDNDAISVLKLKDDSLKSIVFDPDRSYVLSTGMAIHVLRLIDSEVHVTRYTMRDPVIPKPITYMYNVWPYNVLTYSSATTEFAYDSSNQYNWNGVDRYICDSEKEYSELTEPMKYWRTRFVLLPVKYTPVNPNVTQHTSRRYNSSEMTQIEGFLKLLENMNKIKRGASNRPLFAKRNKDHQKNVNDRRKTSNERRNVTPERPERKESRSNINDKRTSPIHIDASENNKDMDSANTSRSLTSSGLPWDLPPEHSLSMNSPLQDIIKAMLNPQYGLTFIPKQENLRENTFISAEAVAWMIKSVDGCQNKVDAVALGLQLLENKLILHASGSSRQTFVDGFYLYFIKEEKKEDEPEKRRFWFSDSGKGTEEELLSSYNIQWLEVAVWRKKNGKDDVIRCLQNPLPRDITDKVKGKTEDSIYNDNDVPLYRKMEYNPDINQKSCRAEWCVIAYHGNYYPNVCAYAIEMNWMVSSGAIIADLIQRWSHKAATFGLHIVPTPSCVFPRHTIRCSRNPFRKNPFIPLNIDCLLEPGQKNLFEKYDATTWSRRMLLFQDAILYKFDFLRDTPQTALQRSRSTGCKSYQYIHTSGSLFARINDFFARDDTSNNNSDEGGVPPSPFGGKRKPTKKASGPIRDKYTVDEFVGVYGFFWAYNYALSNKWRGNFTGEVTIARNYMRHTFSDFCANKDNQLVEFWNSICHTYDQHNQESTT